MKVSDIIKELENLSSSEGFYRRDKVAWWLDKHKEEYQSQVSFFDTLTIESESPRSLTKYTNESQLLDLYEVLSSALVFYKNESYYKEQLDVYDLVKNDVEQLNTWLEYHRIDKGYKYKDFVSLFSDNSTKSGFNTTILYPLSLPIKVKLDESEFYYTLKFLEILERSNKVEIIGIVDIINDLEVIRLNKYQAYDKQTIVISKNDSHHSKLLIRFLKGKTKLLDSLKVGDKVKVYSDLIGVKDESYKQGYSLSLVGWDVKVLK